MGFLLHNCYRWVILVIKDNLSEDFVMKCLVVLGMILVLAGCAKPLNEVQIPKNMEEMREVSEYVDKNLDGEEKELANEILVNAGTVITMGLPIDSTLNLEKAIANLKAKKEAEKAQQAKKQEAINEINKVIRVKYISHKPFRKEGLPIQGYEFDINIKNLQEKTIIGVKGELVFTDVFGKESGRIEVESKSMLLGGEDWNFSIKSFPNHGLDSFTDGQYTSKDVVFEPEIVVFQDKTSISVDK